MYDVLIVGGGIGGAVLALSLARSGRKVLILEREKQPFVSGRPEILAQATIEVFKSLGVGERVLREGAWPVLGLEARQWDGKPVLVFDESDFLESGFQPHSTDPVSVRRVLLEEAGSRAEFRRGVTVQSLIRKNGIVCGVQTDAGPFEARVVVGDDGGHSKVREELGLTIDLKDFPLRFLVPKRFLPAAHPTRTGQARFDLSKLKDGVAAGLFLPAQSGESAFVYGMTAAGYDKYSKNPASFLPDALRVTADYARDAASKLRFPEDYILVARPFGHASAYVADGAAILGDAAHPVTPVGGQGANMSVHDAVALSETLDAAFRAGDFSAKFLSAYERKRRAANERSIAFSARAAEGIHRAIRLPWIGQMALRAALAVAPANKSRFIRAISTTFLSRND